jgi:hypothetical protein
MKRLTHVLQKQYVYPPNSIRLILWKVNASHHAHLVRNSLTQMDTDAIVHVMKWSRTNLRYHLTRLATRLHVPPLHSHIQQTTPASRTATLTLSIITCCTLLTIVSLSIRLLGTIFQNHNLTLARR